MVLILSCKLYFNKYVVVLLQVCGEKQRFEKLMEHFRNEDNNIDFMVSAVYRHQTLLSVFTVAGPAVVGRDESAF